jgi:hypothetical protein
VPHSVLSHRSVFVRCNHPGKRERLAKCRTESPGFSRRLDKEPGDSEYPCGTYQKIDQYFHLRPGIFMEFSTQRRQPKRLKPQPEMIQEILPVVEEDAAYELID